MSSSFPAKDTSKRSFLFRFITAGLLFGLLTLAITGLSHLVSSEEHDPVPVFIGISNHPEQETIPLSMQCGACHEQIFREWADSDHAWAQRNLNSRLDAEPFHAPPLQAHGSTVSFSTNDRSERILYDNQSGKSWKMDMAIGRTPLIQYLSKGSHGGYHTTSAAWDVNKKEWFDMFGADSRSPEEWGHWTGRGMVWNSQCAWCHMSDFEKKYDTSSHQYHSTWKEPGVTCIQCHGPLLTSPEKDTGCMIQTGNRHSLRQTADNCASCHARRDELDDKFKAGNRFDDHFQLTLPVHPGTYWPNGMQRDEVYTETGLRLSRMGKAGVQCLDCHTPHSAKLKYPAENNALCMQCHEKGDRNAPVISPLSHSRHKEDSTGNRCVECHMPESLYMGRDPRRDHSFASPDPLLTKEMDIPNSCIMCHKDQNNDWALKHVKEWYGDLPLTSRRERSRAINKAFRAEPDAFPALVHEWNKEENPSWRATLLDLMEPWADSAEAIEIATKAVKSPHSLERVAAAKILSHTKSQAMLPLLKDSVKSVRIQAAWGLRDMLDKNAPIMKELEATALHQADQPGGAMKLAQIYSSRVTQEKTTPDETADWNKKADYWFQKAREWDPSSSVVHRDYSIFLASLGKSEEALKAMEYAAKLEPQNPELHYLLALAYAETGKQDKATLALDKALELDPSFARAAYTRAILKHDSGNLSGALLDMELAIKAAPGNPEYIYYKIIYLSQSGKKAEARVLAKELVDKFPQFPPARQLMQELR